ncbi:hypothetical protein Pfo_017831 [Paulownia fortunei]|nr:hypothetical protein Pfo_017831 [Paulownia fortunei]
MDTAEAAAWNSTTAHRLVPDEDYAMPALVMKGRKQVMFKTQTSDGFEFETSKRFNGQFHFGTSQNFESWLGDDQGHQARVKYRGPGDSLAAIAFADELLLNGLLRPLKLPPRLQFDSDFNSFSRRSPALSPESLARKSAWNDDFDPFTVALQKVREEKRGRNSHLRRIRSYSPFRIMFKCSSDSPYCNQDLHRGNSPMKQMQVPSYSGPLEFKGSLYARWVQDQTKEGGLSPRGAMSLRGLLFRQSQRISAKGNYVKENCGNVTGESKVQKLKAILQRYTSLGRENSGCQKTKITSEDQKLSYFSRLSFKFKGNAHCTRKKKMPADTKMAVAEYKPSLAL